VAFSDLGIVPLRLRLPFDANSQQESPWDADSSRDEAFEKTDL
jgi:hypothetical protein